MELPMTNKSDLAVDDYFAEFIERQVKDGRYRSASDVVEAGLRLLEVREAKLEALRSALIEGEQSGPSAPFDIDQFLAEVNAERSSTR
jgi:antitoxin ParD1/3/4